MNASLYLHNLSRVLTAFSSMSSPWMTVTDDAYWKFSYDWALNVLNHQCHPLPIRSLLIPKRDQLSAVCTAQLIMVTLCVLNDNVTVLCCTVLCCVLWALSCVLWALSCVLWALSCVLYSAELKRRIIEDSKVRREWEVKSKEGNWIPSHRRILI